MSEFTMIEIAACISAAAAQLGNPNLAPQERWAERVGIELATLELGDSPWVQPILAALADDDWNALVLIARHITLNGAN